MDPQGRSSDRAANLTITVALLWIAIVIAATAIWVATGGPQREPVPSAMWGLFLAWQSALIAAVVVATAGWFRRRPVVGIMGMAFALVITLHEMLALPLDLYGAAEWVREAREAGVFTLW